MTKVNVVYEYVYDHADIIAVPDEIASKIEAIGQEFLHWVPSATDSDYWTIINGRKCVLAGADGFVKWLNSCYCSKTDKAYVVKRDTHYDPQYKMVDF